MTEARRFSVAKETSPGSATKSCEGQVIRPVIGRWLPDWMQKSLRRKRVRNFGSDDTEAQVYQLHPVADKAVASQGCLHELRKSICEVKTEAAEWSEKLANIENSLNRVRKMQQLASERLSRKKLPLPDATAVRLTSLQESYRNCSMSVALLQQKHTTAEQKYSALNQRQEQLTLEIRSLSAQLRSSQSDDDNDTLSCAA